MFVQVIQGRTGDARALGQRFDEWKAELAKGAEGWLGSTAGVTDDGRFVAAVCFESPEAARRNSDRPEQGEWWSKTEPLLDDVEFHDTNEVLTFLGGPDYSAQFVQVIQGTVVDEERARSMVQSIDDELPDVRSDVLGGLVALHGDRFTQAVYFTDEASAREGEARMDEAESRPADEMAQALGDLSYLDLTDPWHHSP